MDRTVSEYLDMLIVSMEKKSAVLDQLIGVGDELDQFLDSGDLMGDGIEDISDRKAALIEKLDSLDDGFEKVYGRISDEVKADPGKYGIQVQKLKDLIREVTDKAARLGTAETRQKEKAERLFEERRKAIGDGRKANRTAFGYYQNMKGYSSPKPNFFDIKN